MFVNCEASLWISLYSLHMFMQPSISILCRFRYEFAAFKRALRIKKLRLSKLPYQQNIVCHNGKVENEKGLLDSVISYFFDEQQLLSTSSCADTQNHMSQSNNMVRKSGLNSVNNWITTSSDMQHVWDLDLISSTFWC